MNNSPISSGVESDINVCSSDNPKSERTFSETGLTTDDSVALLGSHTVGKVGGFDFIKPEKGEAGKECAS